MAIVAHRGLVVLDAHRSTLDILATARYVHCVYHPKKIVMPMAGYMAYVPAMKQAVAWVQRRYNIEFWPVYRKEEYHPVNLLMMGLCAFYPKELTRDKREAANQAYVAAALGEVKKSGVIVVVAPYGGPLWFGGKLKYGARRLLRARIPYVVSVSTWSWKCMAYTTRLSKPASMPHNITEEGMRDRLAAEYAALLDSENMCYNSL